MKYNVGDKVQVESYNYKMYDVVIVEVIPKVNLYKVEYLVETPYDKPELHYFTEDEITAIKPEPKFKGLPGWSSTIEEYWYNIINRDDDYDDDYVCEDELELAPAKPEPRPKQSHDEAYRVIYERIELEIDTALRQVVPYMNHPTVLLSNHWDDLLGQVNKRELVGHALVEFDWDFDAHPELVALAKDLGYEVWNKLQIARNKENKCPSSK